MNKLVMILLAIFLPPIAVLIKEGVGFHLLLNILLLVFTLGVGAMIHALWVIMKDGDPAV
ncbi:MAG: YqaE/Pmp3 family membrane protein [Planctomycetes bacterium]|jgi:uncharacterized membrane protein YqaE (UPF0057 family)|nr:YqaE/Pmp3 family membrane protein [Planctomycetota bacterium]